MGIVELKDLVSFGLALGELVAGLVDGVGFDDVAKVVKVGIAAAKGLGHAKQALIEYANMSDSEAAELEAFVKQEFDIADDAVEAAIEAGLSLVIKLHDLAKLFVK
jgi:hypothetical protein